MPLAPSRRALPTIDELIEREDEWQSFDTETTGLDSRHGCRPFFETFGQPDGSYVYYEWDVDPFTREPIIPDGDLEAIQDRVDGAVLLVGQNVKFDVAQNQSLPFPGGFRWDWRKVLDTLLAGHLLASNLRKDLTTQVLRYLRIDIQPYERRLHEAVIRARTICRTKAFVEKHGLWRIGKDDDPMLPSGGGKGADYWLPRAVAKAEGFKEGHPHFDWWTVLRDYGNVDGQATLPLMKRQLKLIRGRKLWPIYRERLRLLRVTEKMEGNGVTANLGRVDSMIGDYSAKAKANEARIVNTVGPEILPALPKSGTSKAMVHAAFEVLKLPVVKRSDKTQVPSLDKQVIDTWLAELPGTSPAYTFAKELSQYRSLMTAITYMKSYRRFGVPVFGHDGAALGVGFDEFIKLHPFLNPTGTATLRWSSENPNSQNVSKKEDFNLRYCFGPVPGREWWSLDAKNIELRLPAYESGETEMIQLFERPDDPPYFGSNHLLVFDILHPEKFAKYGKDVKKVYASTWYQWVKNGNFAVQYGAIESSGTADRAYHVPDAQRRIQSRFTKIAELNQRCIRFAEKHGFIETMPDRTVDPSRGYPLLCTRTEQGGILPTTPLNYRIQGTAMWWMGKAMVRCQEALDEWNREALRRGRHVTPAIVRRGYYLPGEEPYRLVMQVHDELVFDFPRGATPQENLPKVREIQRLMEMGGDDIGIPTAVSCEYHAETWSEGQSF